MVATIAHHPGRPVPNSLNVLTKEKQTSCWLETYSILQYSHLQILEGNITRVYLQHNVNDKQISNI